MKFILPRLLGLTVLAGIAVFILSMVFKLLLAGLILAGIGTLVAKMIRKNRSRALMGYGKEMDTFLPYHNNFRKQQQKAGYFQDRKENLAIIPIQ